MNNRAIKDRTDYDKELNDVKEDFAKQLSELNATIIQLRKLREEERVGRTRAEKRLRELHLIESVQQSGGFILPPIGIVCSSFNNRRGTPHQSLVGSQSLSTIQFQSDIVASFQDITAGLEDFSHLWVIYMFHQNTNIGKAGGANRTPVLVADSDNHHGDSFLGPVGTFKNIKTKISPPRKSDETKVGVFACRSPHRPNPIGLSVVKLLWINTEQKSLLVSGLDAVVGSPILDIKPYVPYCDSVDNASTPKWINDANRSIPFTVTFHPLAFWNLAHGTNLKRLLHPYENLEALCDAIKEILSNDVRSKFQKIMSAEHQEYELVFNDLCFKYVITDVSLPKQIVINSVSMLQS